MIDENPKLQGPLGKEAEKMVHFIERPFSKERKNIILYKNCVATLDLHADPDVPLTEHRPVEVHCELTI